MGDVFGWAWLCVGIAIVCLVLVAGWLSWTAGRLDRMHLRSEVALAALHTQLVRRAALASDLASGGLKDPASALLLLDAAQAARDSPPGQWQPESDLTAALLVVDLPADDPLHAELADASRRVTLARRIHNDLAASAAVLHGRRRVRWFRLAGHAPLPTMVEFDDRPLPRS